MCVCVISWIFFSVVFALLKYFKVRKHHAMFKCSTVQAVCDCNGAICTTFEINGLVCVFVPCDFKQFKQETILSKQLHFAYSLHISYPNVNRFVFSFFFFFKVYPKPVSFYDFHFQALFSGFLVFHLLLAHEYINPMYSINWKSNEIPNLHFGIHQIRTLIVFRHMCPCALHTASIISIFRIWKTENSDNDWYEIRVSHCIRLKVETIDCDHVWLFTIKCLNFAQII